MTGDKVLTLIVSAFIAVWMLALLVGAAILKMVIDGI